MIHDPLRIGMLGTGRFAAAMAPRLVSSPDVALVGVLSRDAGRADDLARRHGARAFTDLGAMAAEVDAFYVCGATGRHVDDSLACLDAGLPILCEKPMGTDAGGTARVLEMAKAAGILFVEAFWTCHLPAWQATKAKLAEGTLGRPLRMNADLSRDMPPSDFPRVWSEDDGCLRDMGVYPVCLALWLLGPANLTDADVTWVDGVDAKARLRLDHETGAQSLLTIGFLEQGPCEALLRGELGELTIHAPLLGTQTIAGPSGRETHPFGEDRYHPQFAHFARLVRDGAMESPIVPHALSRSIAEIIEAARRT